MKKIMFYDPCGLTQATISGQKTMTRRVMKIQPITARHWNPKIYGTNNVYYKTADGLCQLIDEKGKVIHPKYQVGEIVAVAEKVLFYWKDTKISEYEFKSEGCCKYFLDNSDIKEQMQCIANESKDNIQISYRDVLWRCKSRMYMSSARYFIKILSVRAERLQDISDEDCLKEGVRYITDIDKFYFENVAKKEPEGFYFDNPRDAFASLIDKVSGKGTWENNHFVWVYEYELINKE